MVDRHAAPIFDQYEINNDRILRELALMGFANIADYGRIGDDGEFRVDLSETSRDQFAAVSSVKSKRSVRTIGDVEIDEITTEIKLSEKRAALMDLARIRGLTKDDGGAGANVTFNVFWNPGGPLPQPYDDEEDAA